MNDSVHMDPIEECDVLILGGGLAGLAAASVLGDRAVVLERTDRPGGLVRTECYDGYWFDHVIHLLYFPDDATKHHIEELVGDVLAPCPPQAWVETAKGIVRFPFQMHLGNLEPQTVIHCLRDLAKVTFEASNGRPRHFQDMLERTFGKTMCDVFMLPYNRKMWKRPLTDLAPAGFTWNITPPDFEKVLKGAVSPDRDFCAYNSHGCYPRPPGDSPVRGMEVLSHRLAQHTHDLRLGHTVESIDTDQRLVTARHQGRPVRLRYRHACGCTVPLPLAVGMCMGSPADLVESCQQLTRNRVLTVTISLRGPRPQGRGHWRYYGDESVLFTRLIYLHEFDPDLAPPDGWGMLAEITEPAEHPMGDPEQIIQRVLDDAKSVGAWESDCQVIDTKLLEIDPAYVVFTLKNKLIVEQAQAFLRQHDIEPVGRYGRWEYSSMGQVMRDALEWAREVAGAGDDAKVRLQKV